MQFFLKIETLFADQFIVCKAAHVYNENQTKAHLYISMIACTFHIKNSNSHFKFNFDFLNILRDLYKKFKHYLLFNSYL